MQKDRHPYAALRRDHCAFHVPAAETVDHTAVRRADRVRGHAAKKVEYISYIDSKLNV